MHDYNYIYRKSCTFFRKLGKVELETIIETEKGAKTMYDFLEERENSYRSIVRQAGLPAFLNFLPKNLRGNPYHNSHHAYSVAVNSYKFGKNEGLDEDHLISAFVAGITHDLGYLKPALEQANIINAIKFFNHTAEQLYFTTEQLNYGTLLIENTMNTGTPKDYSSFDSDAWIVHDADLGVWFDIEHDEASYLCEGLSVETETSVDLHLTYLFLQNHGMGTITGKNKLESFVQNYATGVLSDKWTSPELV